ncbi:hypothetical protein HS041_08830 [Planomonospora sp. ID67723]|uniref:hypothetical protein n=1 Tax=Planomonospora sp. ID67723 TaxID=2738134 RepID=UPI0018C40E2A|nr:hypothetical protein [Planomonospora sp. ID67723]MBG0827868.1 hypothetical protein [Planomonospora sp. ID67723]
MNIFVLGTGRCGTTTFIRACEHLDNFTAGHETLSQMCGEDRFAYPGRHIEADNRLSWFLGQLALRYDGRDVLYVHLRRDPEAVVSSFLKRWDSTYRASIMRSYAHGLLQRASDWPERERALVCRSYVDTVTANIEEFLRHRDSTTMWLEEADWAFPGFLDRIGAVGDLEAARAEWRVQHNASV